MDRTVNSDIAGAQPLVLPRGLMGRQLHSLLTATDQLSCPGVTEFCPHLISSHLRSLPPFTSTTTKSTPVKPSNTQKHLPSSCSPPLPFSPRRVVPVPMSSVSLSPMFSSPSMMDGSPGKNDGVDLREYGASGQLLLVRAILGPLDTEEVRVIC